MLINNDMGLNILIRFAGYGRSDSYLAPCYYWLWFGLRRTPALKLRG